MEHDHVAGKSGGSGKLAYKQAMGRAIGRWIPRRDE
jgi:hypothetical protein